MQWERYRQELYSKSYNIGEKSIVDNIDLIIQKAKKDDKILAVVLYGSFARNENTYNDIDICLFSFDGRITSKKEINYRTTFPEIFDIHFFHKLPLYVQAEVLNDGNILLNKDYERLFDIYEKTLKDYSMFKPHFQFYLEA